MRVGTADRAFSELRATNEGQRVDAVQGSRAATIPEPTHQQARRRRRGHSIPTTPCQITAACPVFMASNRPVGANLPIMNRPNLLATWIV